MWADEGAILMNAVFQMSTDLLSLIRGRWQFEEGCKHMADLREGPPQSSSVRLNFKNRMGVWRTTTAPVRSRSPICYLLNAF